MFTKRSHRAGPSIAILLLTLLKTAIALAANAPMSPAQLALYQGADREKILTEGAKKEGQLTLYDSHTWFRTFVKEFEKKYPFIKVSEWRNDSKNVIRRAMEEFKSSRNLADVIETTAEGMGLMKRDAMFQEYYSPEARYYPDDVKSKGKNGLYYLGDRETYNSLGFNTNVIGPNEAPRMLKELLDPKWKGKMSIVSTSTGVRWIGNTLNTMGREFLDKMAEQELKVQDMSGAALSGLVASGEVPLSPTIFDADVTVAKQKGAPRQDIGTVEQKFKKTYLDEKYSLEDLEVKFSQWENLMRQLFIRKR